MTIGTILELAIGVALILGGIWLYRKRGREDRNHGSQAAVILFIVGAIMLIHGSGLLEYRPGRFGP